jgi:hypothetical protein
VPPVDGGDLIDAEAFGAGDYGRIDGAEGQGAVAVDEVGDAQPVGGLDGLDRGTRRIA